MIFRKVNLIIFILVSFSVSESVFGDDGTTQYQVAMELKQEIIRSLSVREPDNYIYDDRYKEMLKLLEDAANKGHPHAQTLVGVSYTHVSLRKPLPRKRNYRKAFEWLKKAHENGDIRGTYHLAILYSREKRLPQNKELVVQLFRKVIEAIQNGKVSEFKDTIIPPNESLILFRMNSIYHVASSYFKGEGVPKDRKIALDLFQHVEKNKIRSMSGRYLAWYTKEYIAKIYCEGVGGVQKNLNKCIQYYEQYLSKNTYIPDRRKIKETLDDAKYALIQEEKRAKQKIADKKWQAEDKKREAKTLSDPDNFLIQ